MLPARAYRTEKTVQSLGGLSGTCRGKADRKVQRTCVVVTAMVRVYYVNLFSAYPNNISKIVDFGTHFESILGPWANLGRLGATLGSQW